MNKKTIIQKFLLILIKNINKIKPTMIDIINPQVEERIPCAKKNANELRRTHYTLGSQRKSILYNINNSRLLFNSI